MDKVAAKQVKTLLVGVEAHWDGTQIAAWQLTQVRLMHRYQSRLDKRQKMSTLNGCVCLQIRARVRMCTFVPTSAVQRALRSTNVSLVNSDEPVIFQMIACEFENSIQWVIAAACAGRLQVTWPVQSTVTSSHELTPHEKSRDTNGIGLRRLQAELHA